MSPDLALAAVRRLAATVNERSESEAEGRLLERIAGSADPELLRDALVELGARELLRGGPDGRRACG